MVFYSVRQTQKQFTSRDTSFFCRNVSVSRFPGHRGLAKGYPVGVIKHGVWAFLGASVGLSE
jgi:hypothetical protein